MSSSNDSSKPHHRARGFQNNYVEFQPRSLGELLRWRREAARAGLPRPPLAPTPQVAPDLPWLHANAKAGAQMAPAVTWIGHSTVMAQLGGLTLLTDPMFSQRASPVQFAGPRRHVPPGIALPELPRVDLVLVSHNHYDHLDAASVAALNRQPGGPPLFVVPLGLASWFAAQGIRNVVELDWWDSHRIARPQGETEVVLVPAQHWSSRGPREALATLWGGSPCSRRTAICSLPATPATRATSATSGAASRAGRHPNKAAASTSRCCPSAPTSRAGS